MDIDAMRSLEVRDGVAGKVCARCGAWKPLTGFNKKLRFVHSWCKECLRAERAVRPQKDRRSYYQAYNEAHREKREQYRQLNRERLRAQMKQYRIRYPEKKREANRRYAERNKAKKREAYQRWRRSNPDKASKTITDDELGSATRPESSH